MFLFISFFFNYFTLSFFFYTFFTHDIYPHPHPRPATHTHDPRPLPTTHDPRHLATLFSVPLIILADLLGNNVYLHEFKRSWFVIRDWWISIRFVCFVFQDSLLCDRPVSGNNRLVEFASQIFLIFLILVTCKNKATSACFLRQKNPLIIAISFSILEQCRVILSRAGRPRYIVICINPAFTKMIDGTEKPTFAIRANTRSAINRQHKIYRRFVYTPPDLIL